MSILKKRTVVAHAALTAAMTVPAIVSAQSTTIHGLTVRRDTSTAFTNAEADAAFQLANDGATVDDGASDIACDHALARSGDVATFSNPSGWDCTTITSSNEMSACLNRPGFLKANTSITFCGQAGVTIIGCAFTPGNTMIIERGALTGGVRGAVVNHEFGHTTGLAHRGTNNAIFIMKTHRSTRVAAA